MQDASPDEDLRRAGLRDCRNQKACRIFAARLFHRVLRDRRARVAKVSRGVSQRCRVGLKKGIEIVLFWCCGVVSVEVAML